MAKGAKVLPLFNARTREQWATKLNEIWTETNGRTLEGIFALGDGLIAAKAEVPHREFREMLEKDAKFTPRTAQRHIAIVSDQRLVKATRVSELPPHWGTLYELTKLDDLSFKKLVDDGTICPELERSDIKKILRSLKIKDDEKRILQLRPIKGTFRTIVLDPAWDYGDQSLAGRANPDYAKQTHDDLLALNVKAWADDEVGTQLYLWVTNNFLTRGCQLIEHWGFTYRTVITWIKPPPFGLGSYFRNSTEQCLFATYKDTTTREAAASLPTHFEAPRGEHSEKPEKFYNIVRAASYPPYAEGNQRAPRADFTNLFETVEDA